MPNDSPGPRLSIQQKLPLLNAGLLLAVVVGFGVWAYGEVRRSAITVANERLRGVTRQLADLMTTGARLRLTETQQVAADSAVQAFVAAPRAARRPAALRALERLRGQGQLVAAVELWDTAGRRMLAVGAALPPPEAAGPEAQRGEVRGPDSAVVGPLRSVHDTLQYAVVAPVTHGGRAIGYVMQRRRIAASRQAGQQLAELIGSGARLLIGNASGDVWTDFSVPVPGPPVSRSAAGDLVAYEREGAAVFASVVPVPGTSWALAVEFPQAAILARVRRFLVRLIPVGILLVILGGLAGWLVSRRLTTPLRRLTAAADAIAAGDYSRRVDVTGRDEAGRLGAAFNAMTERIADAHQHLAARVAERTTELEGANRELEAFSYTVSHDLRAPLRALDGFSRILLEDFGPHLEPEAQRLLGVVRENSQRMGDLIDDLLHFSQLSRTELEPTQVDMAALVRAVVEDLRNHGAGPLSDPRVGVLPPTRGDAALLRQVWTNLIANAVKFTRPRPQPDIEIGGETHPGDVVYFVRDNGVGFDMRFAEKLFGVFQRLHRQEEFEGTGVGLAIVQRIVHRHGGRAWAQAEPDRGATFYFALPRQGVTDGDDRPGSGNPPR